MIDMYDEGIDGIESIEDIDAQEYRAQLDESKAHSEAQASSPSPADESEGDTTDENGTAKKGNQRGAHFSLTQSLMEMAQASSMIATDEKVDVPTKILNEIATKATKEVKGKPIVIYQPLAGFHFGDGTPVALTPSQLCTLIGLGRLLDMLRLQDTKRFEEYRTALKSNIYDDNHTLKCTENAITLKLSTFSRMCHGDKYGRQEFYKAKTNQDLLFFNALYGRFLTNAVGSSLFNEICNESLISYKYNTDATTGNITTITITFHDAFIYRESGFTQFPIEYADLISKYGNNKVLFTYLLLDLIKERGLIMGTIKENAKLINAGDDKMKGKVSKFTDMGKSKKDARNIAKAIDRKEQRIYKHTKKYLLEKVLGINALRYKKSKKLKEDAEAIKKMRTTDWREDLRDAIQRCIKIGIIEDVANYGDGHGTFKDSDGGLGCDLRINERW